jgi:hypothetical protein
MRDFVNEDDKRRVDTEELITFIGRLDAMPSQMLLQHYPLLTDYERAGVKTTDIISLYKRFSTQAIETIQKSFPGVAFLLDQTSQQSLSEAIRAAALRDELDSQAHTAGIAVGSSAYQDLNRFFRNATWRLQAAIYEGGISPDDVVAELRATIAEAVHAAVDSGRSRVTREEVSDTTLHRWRAIPFGPGT